MRNQAAIKIWMLVVWTLVSFAPQSVQSAQPIQPASWKVLYHEEFENGVPGDWNLDTMQGPGIGWTLETEGGNTYLSATGHVTAPLRLGPWDDFRFKVRVRMIEEGVHLNFRTAGGSRYMIPLRAWGLQIFPVRPDGSGPGIVQQVNENVQLNRWYTVEIVGIGATIRVYVDGILKMEYVDVTPMLVGSVSLECLARAHFDDVEISGPDQPQGLAWIGTGGPLGGIGYDIKMRPGNPDMMYVTDVRSGLHKSVDGGRTWTASNQGISSRAGASGDAIPIFCVTVDPSNPDTVWVGTQNIRGIFKSTDGGTTWTEKSKGIVEQTGISFRGIAVDPHNSLVVYAAAEISSYVWAGETRYGTFDLTKGVVYKSSDGGENWVAIWRGDNLARYVLIDPRNSDVLYVSTGIFDREAANSDLLHGVPRGVGILKSTDGGKTWKTLNQANGLTNLYIGSLFMNPANPDILLAGAGLIGHPDQGGVYLSTDGGEHWQSGVDVDGHSIRTIITSVEFAVSDPRIAYACGYSAFFRSEDGAATWRLIAGDHGGADAGYGPPGIKMGFPIDLQADPRNPYRIFINNYGGGNFLSEDGGATWTNASKGYTGGSVNGIAVSPYDRRLVYAIGQSGIFNSEDAGENWQGLGYGVGTAGDPGVATAAEAVTVSPDRAERVLVSDLNLGIIWLSNDRGMHWRIAFKHPLTSPNNRHGFKSMVFAPSDPSVVYAGIRCESIVAGNYLNIPSFGIYKSLDGGETWQEANDAVSAGKNVNVIAVDSKDPRIVYAGTMQHGVLRTRDGGRSWVIASQGLPGADVRALAIDPTDSRILYASIESGGLYKSTDGADHWQQGGAGMDPQMQVRAIVIDPTNPQILYAGDFRSGVYRSEDRGRLWTQINLGLRTRSVQDLAISRDGSTLYAATGGEGVFRLELRPPTVDCTYTIASSSNGLASSSALGSVTVTPSANTCTWTSTSNASWITVTSGSSGTGSGSVTYSVAANTTGGTRTGTITVGGSTITMTQTAFNAALYFPHVDTSLPWQTEIAVINAGNQTVTGTLRALNDAGQLVQAKDVTLSAHGRRQIAVADEFTNHTEIGYIVFDTNSAAVQGYTKLYQSGKYRAAIPAVKGINSSDIYIPHIASDADWWTGITLVNTTSVTKEMTIIFNAGLTVPYTLKANERKPFTIGSLLGQPFQPAILSAVITNASGVTGLELFGSLGWGTQLEGILLTGQTTPTIYYPHVANAGDGWWTGIVAYNPSGSECTITITPYSAQGMPLTPSTKPIPGKGKYIGAVADLNLPIETAWFKIDSTSPINGFELFGTLNGQQLAAYAEKGGTGAKSGVFPKIEKDGWTGIAFVNTEATAASVTLTAYKDDGSLVATQVLPVAGYAKVVNNPQPIFSQDIGSATYIAYSSDRNVIGFQLNGSAEGTMLDALPGLAGTN